MVFFTADTHFGHENVVEMCARPFHDIKEMNEAIIAAWNSRVSGNDTVYIVGDMFYRCDDPESILKRLKGRKKLVLGNHDGSWIKKIRIERYFISVDTMLEISDGVHGLTLCHYPLLTWKHAKKNYMIHGHIHNDITADYWPLIQKRDRVLNAGVDINNYMPVTFSELVENNVHWKELYPAH